MVKRSISNCRSCLLPILNSNRNTALIFLATALALTSVACNSETSISNSENAPFAKESGAAKAEHPANLGQGSLDRSAALTIPSSNRLETSLKPHSEKLSSTKLSEYQQALDKAASADSISKSALSAEDWRLAASQWQDAIAYLSKVPSDSFYKDIAQSKISEYQKKLTYAARQANAAQRYEPDSVVTIAPVAVPKASVVASTPVETAPMQLENQSEVDDGDSLTIRVPIKRRAGGTPVIDVTFNGSQEIEMIVDTGASGTVITKQAAAALGVKSVAKTKANTASAKGVEFAIGYVKSIKVAGAQSNNVPVAIAGPELEIGLLGHDFFGNYDVTIKRDVIEFHTRS